MNVEDLIRGKHMKSVIRADKRRTKAPRLDNGFSVIIENPYSNRRVGEVYERHLWLIENVGRRNYTVYKKQTADGRSLYHQFVFQDKNHAMLFKLTWGGN